MIQRFALSWRTLFAALSICLFSSSQLYGADWGAIEVAGRTIEPAEKLKFTYLDQRSFDASYLDAPIFVARGAQRGYTLCVSAGIHGDELNGMEIARQSFARVDPDELSGTLIVLPVVNTLGARSGKRYMIDRRDLNRSFPGNPNGSVASLVAHALYELVLKHCHALVDLHTGSNRRTNQPQIRVTGSNERALDIAKHFGVGVIVLGDGPEGSLRRETSNAGIPAIIYEAGEPNRFQPDEIAQGVRGVISTMRYLSMLPVGEMVEVAKSDIFSKTMWTRVPRGGGGYFFPHCSLGDAVAEGDLLGYVIDPTTDAQTEVRAPVQGEIIGMAVPQIVLSGTALFHIGIFD